MINNKGYTIFEVLIVLFGLGIIITIGYVVYSNVVVDTYTVGKIGEDMSKIISYYEQRDCSTVIPVGVPTQNPYGYNYNVICGGNKRLITVTTTLPSSVRRVTIPQSKKGFYCYMNSNTLTCFKLWSMGGDGGAEKKNLYNESL